MRTKVLSLLLSVYSMLQRCHDAYPLEAYILRYYPQFYFAKLVQNRLGRGHKVEKGDLVLDHQAIWTPFMKIDASSGTIALWLVIIGSLGYTFLIFYCYFFDESSSSKRKDSKAPEFEDLSRTEENPYGLINPVSTKLLDTSLETGLSEDEVLFTALSAFVAQDWRDVLIICGLLAYNDWFSVISVRQYDDIAKSFALNSSIQVLALRDGKIVNVSLKELVPGDIVHVSEGCVIPADCKVTSHDASLFIDQSSITSENPGVEKFHGDTCYAGTGVLRGDTFLTVIATGYQTFLGRTLSIFSDPSPGSNTPLKLSKTTTQEREFRWLIECLGIAFCVVVFSCLVVIWNISSSSKMIFEPYLAVILVTVPATLITKIGSIRAHAASRLVKNGVIVQTAISQSEHLAGIDTLCVDKTGTLTENRLTILEPYSVSGDPDDVILAACLTISPNTENHDPIDKTFIRALNRYPGAKTSLNDYKLSEFEPFNPETKRMGSVVEGPSGESIFCTKGAPKAVLEICLQDNPDTQNFAEKYKNMATEYAQRGLRSLGVARKDGNHKWELLGLVPLLDPPRFDSARAIRKATILGVSVRMFTGDATSIARVMARNLGLRGNSLVAESISDDKALSRQEVSELVGQADLYAEVYSSDKEKIVCSLQSKGHLVAATGDGVDDAPILRRANCGIAVEGSTEIAQSASDLVFLKPGVSRIVQTIEKSRQTFQLTYTYIVYRTSVSLYAVIFLLFYFKAHHETINLNLLILNIHLSDIICIPLCHDHQFTPYPKSPARWNFWKIFSSVVLLSSILLLGTWSVITWLPDIALYNSADTAALRAQISFLHIVLSSHSLILFIRTNGRFWAYNSSWPILLTVLSINVGATVLCMLGYTGNGHVMELATACWVWISSFGTLCLAAGSLCLLIEPYSPLVLA